MKMTMVNSGLKGLIINVKIPSFNGQLFLFVTKIRKRSFPIRLLAVALKKSAERYVVIGWNGYRVKH